MLQILADHKHRTTQSFELHAAYAKCWMQHVVLIELLLHSSPLVADVGVSGVARPCSRASEIGESHRLGSGKTPAASMCAVSRSYCVLYGANCEAK